MPPSRDPDFFFFSSPGLALPAPSSPAPVGRSFEAPRDVERRIIPPRREPDGPFYVVTDRWQKFTSLALSAETLADLARHCDEFLVHAVDVEGKQSGVGKRAR